MSGNALATTALLVATTMLAGCVVYGSTNPPPPAFDLSVPAWQVGQNWTEFLRDGPRHGLATSTVEKFQRVVDGYNDTVEVVVVTNAVWTEANGTFTHERVTLAMRASDGAKMDELRVVSAGADGDGPILDVIRIRWSAPCPGIHAARPPVWVQKCSGTVETRGSGGKRAFSTTAQTFVLDASQISVPAGTFDAVHLRIEQVGTGAFAAPRGEELWYAASVCHAVQRLGDGTSVTLGAGGCTPGPAPAPDLHDDS